MSGLTTTCLLTGSLEERLATYVVGVIIAVLGMIAATLHRQDEVGTPHRILVDDDTLAIGVIQLQERDSGLFVSLLSCDTCMSCVLYMLCCSCAQELMSIESVLPSILRLYSRSNFV